MGGQAGDFTTEVIITPAMMQGGVLDMISGKLLLGLKKRRRRSRQAPRSVPLKLNTKGNIVVYDDEVLTPLSTSSFTVNCR